MEINKKGWFLDSPASKRIIIILTIIIGILLVGFAWANKTVTINVDGKETKVKTFAFTVGQLLKSEDIQIGEEDRVTPAQNKFLRNGTTIIINRAIPLILNVGGNEKSVYTHSSNVQELLDEFGIVLQQEDLVHPGLEEMLIKGMTVEIIRQRTEILEEEVSIPNKTIQEDNYNIPRGTTRTIQEGQPGLERKVWEITYRNGTEYSRQLISSEVIRKPEDRVIHIGAGQVISRGGETFRYSRELNMRATAYTYTGNNTASGVPPSRGTVAVDPSVIPMGTRLYVEGYGKSVALDRGGAIRGNRIDLFMGTRQEALQWGVRNVKVYVLE